MEIEHLNETGLIVSSQQSSLPSISSRDANILSKITCIKPDPDEMEYSVNTTSQGVFNQHILLPSPLKCEVKEEMMYCQFCSYIDVDFGRLKCHTFTQHPTGAAVVRFGESDHDIKFFCVKETCNFSTTMCTVCEEHLMNCCPLHQTLSGEEKERLKSTLQFVLDFHNKHCLDDMNGFLEYLSSFNTTYTSEDQTTRLRKNRKQKDFFSVRSSSSSVSDVQSSMVCEDLGERKLEDPFISVQNPVPVFIVQNQNTNLIEGHTNISENTCISLPVRNQNKNNELLLETDTYEYEHKVDISASQAYTPMEMQTEKKSFTCEVCDKCFQYRSEFVIHLRTHTGENPFKCDICDKGFVYSCDLIRHKRTHTGERPFKCLVCNKCYTSSSALTKHKRMHTGEKPFKCNVCNKEFRASGDHIVHKRTHTGEKPYKCDICDKAFTVSSYFKIHKRIHTGDKPFNCNVCDKAFAQSSSLVRHKRRHTGEKPYKCSVCGKEFIDSWHLISHKRKHTGEKPYKCNVCDKCFTESSSLTKHKRRHICEKAI